MVITGYLFQVVEKKFENEGIPVDHENARKTKLRMAKVKVIQKKIRQKASEDTC